MMPRNSAELLNAMKTGAVLKSRWKSRTISRPRMLYTLTYPDGSSCNVQYSMIDALLRHKQIRISGLWSGGRCDYEVVR